VESDDKSGIVMKLGYVCADQGISVRGVRGASAHLRSLSGALARRGHEVVVACRRLDGPHAVPDGVTGVELDSAPGPELLRELFLRHQTDVVLERHSAQGGGAMQAAAQLGLPYFLEVDIPFAEDGARRRDLFAGARGVLAVSTPVRDYVVAGGASPEAVTVVPNGVDVARFASRRRRVRSRIGLSHRYVVGFTGSLVPSHGVATLLEAFAGLDRAAVLLVVGDGPERPRLENLARELGVRDRVSFVGAVPHGEVPEWLGMMDVATAPYAPQPVFYSSPLKISEYLAAGLPVVASGQGDIPRLVGEAGLLVPPGEAPALQHALEALQADVALRMRLAASARVRARSLDWDSIAAQVEPLLIGRGQRLELKGAPAWRPEPLERGSSEPVTEPFS
jgi:glycosyltransferase involved in cell wall biosynthesis